MLLLEPLAHLPVQPGIPALQGFQRAPHAGIHRGNADLPGLGGGYVNLFEQREMRAAGHRRLQAAAKARIEAVVRLQPGPHQPDIQRVPHVGAQTPAHIQRPIGQMPQGIGFDQIVGRPGPQTSALQSGQYKEA